MGVEGCAVAVAVLVVAGTLPFSVDTEVDLSILSAVALGGGERGLGGDVRGVMVFVGVLGVEEDPWEVLSVSSGRDRASRMPLDCEPVVSRLRLGWTCSIAPSPKRMELRPCAVCLRFIGGATRGASSAKTISEQTGWKTRLLALWGMSTDLSERLMEADPPATCFLTCF